METLSEALKNDGWHLSNEAIEKLSENGAITKPLLLEKKALDVDLREISAPFFPEDVAKGKLDSIPGNVVVQVQKVRNISAPKANEESQAAPRMLKIVLTDGHTICHAIEVETIGGLSLNTPPGTKLLLRGESLPTSSGLLLLKPSVVQVLGGRVTALYEKWELNRSLAKHTRGRIGEEGGPPPWIPFGQKIQRQNLQDKNFKSLGEMTAKENAEFEAQRQASIAEAARGGARKVFGGGTKPIVDRNVRSIMDMGFTQEQAEQALRQCRNNVDRALQNLQRRTEGKNGNKEERGNRRRGERDEEGSSGPKPSGQVSLFAFLEDKLPVQSEKEEKENHYQSNSHSYNHNNSSNNQRHNSHPPRGRSDRDRDRGDRDRGDRDRGDRDRGDRDRGDRDRNSNRNSNRNNQNGNSEGRSRDDRNRTGNISSQHQKPPRFQNQQHKYNEPYQNWSYGGSNDHGYEDRGSFNNAPRANKNYDDLNNEPYTRRNQQSNYSNNDHAQDFNRNRRFEMHMSTPPPNIQYKTPPPPPSSYTRQMMEAGMPEIPEFPFKDASSLPPFIGNSAPGKHGFFGGNVMSQPPPPPPPVPALAPASEPPTWQWKVGDKCMAKYWEDNLYYNAEVTGMSKTTCVVRFLEYGNFEEVLKEDCIPLSEDGMSHSSQHNNANSTHNPSNNHFCGILEFRRGGTRPYIKSADGGHRKAQRNSQPVYVPPAQRKD